MPNCWLATSEVRRPWRTMSKKAKSFPSSLPSTFPRSKPFSSACSKAQSCANKACSSRLRCSLNIFLSSSDQLLQSSSWSAWLMARSGCWVKGLFPKNSNQGLRTSSLLVSLYFFNSKNAIFTRWFSCPLFVIVKASPVVSSRILKL